MTTSHPFTTLPHKLPAGRSSVTATVALHSPGSGGVGEAGAEVGCEGVGGRVFVCAVECVCVLVQVCVF